MDESLFISLVGTVISAARGRKKINVHERGIKGALNVGALEIMVATNCRHRKRQFIRSCDAIDSGFIPFC